VELVDGQKRSFRLRFSSSATQRLRLSVPASPLFAKNAAQRHFLTLKP